MGLFPRESLIIYIFKRGIRPFSARIHWGVSNQTRPVPKRLQLRFCSRVMGDFQPDPRPHHPDPLSVDTVLLQNMGHPATIMFCFMRTHVCWCFVCCVICVFADSVLFTPIASGFPGVGCSSWLGLRSVQKGQQGEFPVPAPSQCYAWFSFTSTTMPRKPC